MSNTWKALFTLFCLGLVLVAVSPLLPDADGVSVTGQESLRDVTILFQSDVEGAIEPCG